MFQVHLCLGGHFYYLRLFALGLLLFNIPFAFFGMSSPQAVEQSKEIWWVASLFPFTCLIISLTLLVLILRKKETNKS